MIRLLIIHESLDGGGAERVLVEYLNNIDYTLFDVSLLLVYGGGRYLSDINKSVHYYHLFKHGQIPKNRLSEFIYLNKYYLKYRIERVLNDNRYDTIVSFMEGVSLLAHYCLLERGTKNVSWVHTNMVTNPWSERFFSGRIKEKNAYKRMQTIVFVSKQTRDAFVEKFPDVKSSLDIINNPIDSNRIIRASLEISVSNNGTFTVICVGRMVEVKRFDRIIAAAKLLKDQGCKIKYWICGDGKLRQNLIDLIDRNGMSDDFVLWGFKNNPYPYMKAADVFVLSSDTEGFPTVICEAMVLGKPVVSTNVPGTDELIGNSEYGFLCDKTAESIADAIFKLYSSADVLAEYHNKSISHSLDFDVSKTMKRFNSIVTNECVN